MRHRHIACCVWLVLYNLAGCKESRTVPATQVIVSVTSDLEPERELAKISVAVSKRGGGRAVSTVEYEIVSRRPGDDQRTLPLTLSVVRSTEDSFLLNVTGKGPAGDTAVVQKAVVTFAPERTLLLPIFLGRACLRNLCDGDPQQVCAQTDGQGGCGPIPSHDARSLQAVDPDALPDLEVPSSGDRGDGGVDGGVDANDAGGGTGGSSGTGASGAGGTGGSSGTGASGAGGTGGSSGTDASQPASDAIATAGENCADLLAQACTGHGSTQTLICQGNPSVWTFDGTCDDDSRCDTTLGSTQGTCQPIDPSCAGKRAGPVCNGAMRGRCDPDLLRFTLDACPDHAHCDARAPARCACDVGYADNGLGGCAQIDDCAGNPCGAGGVCTDAVGGYTCTCSAGWSGTGSTACTDIDECATDNGGCARWCTNTVGSRACGPCPQHYRDEDETGCVHVWTQQSRSSALDTPYDVTTDAEGHVYVSGRTEGGLDGQTSAGGSDAFVVKFDSSGVISWPRQFGSIEHDEAQGVATGPNGAVCVVGTTLGGLDGNANAGYSDGFVVKYDSAMQVQWTRQLGANEEAGALGVSIDANGGVYVAGLVNGAFDGTTSAGSNDLFLVKYDSDGQKQWSRQLGSGAADGASGVAADATGGVYVVGHTDGGLDGNANAGGSDLFLVKYDGAGQRQWTRQFGSPMNDYAWGVAADANGDVYVTGYTEGGLDGNASAGSSDIFLAKYDAAGLRQWTRQFGSHAGDYAYDVAISTSGDVYVTGYTEAWLDDEYHVGNWDSFLIKYDAAGQRQWTRQFGSWANDVAEGVAVDASGAAYVAGTTDAAFDDNVNAGSQDVYVVKYDANGDRL